VRSLTPNQVLLFGAVLAVALIIALFPFFPRQLPVEEGDVATADIRSPESKTFESRVLTEQAREQAALAVPPVLVYDPAVRAAQLSTLEATTERVGQVRADEGLSESSKRARLLGVRDLGLSRRGIDTVLALPDDRWEAVVAEAQKVLDATLAGSIASDAVEGAQGALVQQISADLQADEAEVVAGLARGLVSPTLVLDDDATSQRREEARADVDAVRQSIAEGQVIVRAGQPIDATTAEVLAEVGLLGPRVRWDNLLAVIVLSSVAAAAVALYVWYFPTPGLSSTRNLLLLTLLIAGPVLIGKLHFSLVLPDDERRFLAYFLPLVTAPMLIATLLEARFAALIGMLQATFLAFAVVYLPDPSLIATVEPIDALRVLLVYGFGALAGVFAVQRAVSSNQYVAGGVLVSGVVLAILFSLWLLEPRRSASEALWMTAAGSVNGLASGFLTAGGVAAVGLILGVTTRVQLMELSQLNAPLLRRLQDEAPGTFHHSIIIGNLAERAADLVGADALLARVGCYYHDIGKVLQPGYYIENQMAGRNPHDRMDPKQSARVIVQHVQSGLELARKHGLPPRVQAFIPEHHGTRLVPYFYRIASQQDANVDEQLFRYPGPKPQTRETAIVMLADSTEATVRASDDRSPERIDAIVEQTIAERLGEGELDESDLTLRDLRTVAESFKQTLRGVYHPRIAYPEPTETERGALIGRFRPGRRLSQASIPLPAKLRKASTRSRRRPST
jgi:putative nucleotidyltransferase with HDIG domain